MKIYTLEYVNYDEHYIAGVFRTEEETKAFMNSTEEKDVIERHDYDTIITLWEEDDEKEDA